MKSQKNVPLRMCRSCWTGVPIFEFNSPYGGFHCDRCQKRKALEALGRIYVASFKEYVSRG